MATVRDQINAAAFDLGLLQSGEVLSNDDMVFAFARFNDWIDALKTEGLTAYSETRTTWSLTTATSYTVGTGATVNIDRPISPTSITNTGYVNTLLSNSPEFTMGDVLTEDQYAALTYKGTFQSPYPQRYYYNPTFDASGYGSIIPWPIPTASGLLGVIYTMQPVQEFATVDTTFFLPPGFRRFFRTNLAIELAPAFDTQPSAALVQNATESKRNVKLANVRMIDLTPNTQGIFTRTPTYNINTDQR